MPPEINKLLNAPLVYVLVQVRFAPVLSVKDYVSAIQEAVRREYPRFDEVVIQNLKISSTGQAPEVTATKQWIFSNKEQDAGFILQTDSLVFHTTAYDVFGDFLTNVKFILNTVGSNLELSLVERIGLRYVDFIQTTNLNDPLENYFSSELKGFPNINFQKFRGLDYSEAQRVTQFGTINMKLTKKIGGTVLPPDLATSDLVISKTVNDEFPNAILDIDHYLLNSDDFKVESILEAMTNLHTVTTEAFRSIVTPYALEKWN